MDHQPLIADALEQVRGEHAGFYRLVVLAAGEMFGADDPAQIACDLNLDVGEFEFHGKGVVEDQYPGIAYSGPIAA